MKPLVQKLRNDEAAEIAEAALVLPVLFLFLLGIIWFGRAFNIYSTIQQAAQQAAIAASRPTCASCSSGNTFPSGPAVDTAVQSILQASSIDPGQIVNPGTATSPCANSPTYNITFCQEVLLNPASNPTTPQSCGTASTPSQICGTMVTFQYPYQFYFPFTSINFTTITLTAQAESRAEN
jgi:Flp pilus assembly protein TadG